MKLTKATVPKIVIPAGRTEILVFDEGLPGFGLRIRLGGKKTWIAQYRLGRKQRRLTLGSLDKVDADEARQRAKAALAKAQLGQDPQLEKFDTRNQASVTLGVVRDKYLKNAVGRLRPRTYEETARHLTRHWAPLAELPITNIRRATIASRMQEIAAQNGPYAANRARASLSAFFSWAIGEGLAEANPVVGTNKAIDEEERARVLTNDELRLVWRCAGDGEYGRIVRLLILTAQRREEVGGLLWSEINMATATWTIGAGRSKNHLAHDVPLSSRALAILADQPRRESRDIVFGSRVGSFQGWSNAKIALDHRITAANGGNPIPSWRMHDLRRTTSTRLGDIGVLPHVIEATINHVSGFRAGVAGTYNRATYAAEKRAALDIWSTTLTNLVGSS